MQPVGAQFDREKIASILNNCVVLTGYKSPTFSRDPRQAENRKERCDDIFENEYIFVMTQ